MTTARGFARTDGSSHKQIRQALSEARHVARQTKANEKTQDRCAAYFSEALNLLDSHAIVYVGNLPNDIKGEDISIILSALSKGDISFSIQESAPVELMAFLYDMKQTLQSHDPASNTGDQR